MGHRIGRVEPRNELYDMPRGLGEALCFVGGLGLLAAVSWMLAFGSASPAGEAEGEVTVLAVERFGHEFERLAAARPAPRPTVIVAVAEIP